MNSHSPAATLGTVLGDTRLAPQCEKGLAPASDALAIDPPSAVPAALSNAAVANCKATILLVDDEPSVLSALRRLFRVDYTVIQATGGAEGLALLRENSVDLVISDMRMPGMDGTAVLEAVRAFDPGIVRILLTGYADVGSTIAAINRGAIHRYISKPWDDGDIRVVVGEALARRGLELQNQRLNEQVRTQNEALQNLNANLEARVASRTAELEQVNGMLNKAFEDVNTTFTLAMTVFSGLLEMRQDGIAGHSRRVANLASRIASHLGLDSRATQDVLLGGLLHDIGKIGLPDKMLGRPVSTYSAEENKRYRRHPLDGEAALLPLARLHGVACIVRQHHERFDGQGFPDALAGVAITLGARIVAVVSDYDGLMSGGLAERRYSPENAAQVVRGGAGTRYDPHIVDALMLLLKQDESARALETQVDVRKLRPGMVLARDLLSPKGAMLLPAGYAFDARVIRHIGELAQRDGLHLVVSICGPATAEGPAACATALGASA